jgi:hypothetical protein
MVRAFTRSTVEEKTRIDGFDDALPSPYVVVSDGALAKSKHARPILQGAETESGASSGTTRQESRTTLKCDILLEVSNLELYRNNGFRVTGLAIDATAKEISKRGDKLKLMEELGQGAGAHPNAFPINPPPSGDDIREALQRLKDPESRLVDEFFWFWPEAKSSSDEAIQAYLTGDGEKAFDCWYARRREPGRSHVAYHNLAVVNHLMAIEWSSRYLDSLPDEDTRETISAYWSNAIRYWKRVCDSDEVWDALKERIRVLDDPRLTTGLARRMGMVLPEAIASINAAFALKLAERGQTTATEEHLKFIRDTGLDDDVREEVIMRLLKPTRDLYAGKIKEASDGALDPQRRFGIASAILAQTPAISHLLEVFFGKNSHHRTELLDEAMLACIYACSAYQKVTKDLEGYCAVAKQALPYATSAAAKKRVQDAVDFCEQELRQTAFAPFLEDLKNIRTAKHSAVRKLALVKEEIMPRLAAVVRDCGPHSKEAHELQDAVAWALREIGIEAHNDLDDISTAKEATLLAGKLARGTAIKKKLAEDKKVLDENEAGRIASQVHLQIRGAFNMRDHVRIDRQSFTYNSTTVPVAEINGVRFGVFREYRNGSLVKCSFAVGVHSSAGTVVNIECKRTFSSEDQAKADYETIVKGLYSNVIPGVVTRCARSIVTTGVKLGQSVMSADGMTLSNNHLFGRKDVFVPYEQIRYGFNQGVLTIQSGVEPKTHRKFGLRETWNAILFEELLKAIPAAKSKK